MSTTVLSFSSLSEQHQKNIEGYFNNDCRVVVEKLKFNKSIIDQIERYFNIYRPRYIILPQGSLYRSANAIGYIIATNLKPTPRIIAEYNTKNLVIY